MRFPISDIRVKRLKLNPFHFHVHVARRHFHALSHPEVQSRILLEMLIVMRAIALVSLFSKKRERLAEC